MSNNKDYKMNNLFVAKTIIQFELTKALSDLSIILNKYPFTETNRQISLMHPKENSQSITDGTGSLFNFNTNKWNSLNEDYKYFNNEFKHTYFQTMYDILNTKTNGRIRRIRLMNLPPKTCYSMHTDSTIRYHMALKTNPNAFLVFKDGAVVHIPNDGHIYAVDTRRPHSAMNGSADEHRIHLVFCETEKNA